MADDDTKRIAQSAEDAVTYPVLTEELSLPYPTQHPSGTGGIAGTPLAALAEGAIRDVLGWRPREGDPKGFLAALNQSFTCPEESGVTRCHWTPRGYAAQADLGAVTGAQASIYTRAKAALDQALPLLDGLTPLTPFADEEDVSAIRSIIRSDLSALVAELGVEGGPTVARVDNLFESLIGLTPTLDDPEKIGGRLNLLRDRFGLERQNVNTIEEELNYTNFLVLVDHVNTLKRSWDFARPFFTGSDSVEPFLGTQLVLLSRELGVVAESVHELYFALDSVFLGAAERETTVLRLGKKPRRTVLTVAELLGWVDRFASEEGPHLIQDAGKDGVAAVQQTLSKLSRLVRLAFKESKRPSTNPVRGFHTPRVQRAFQELSNELQRAQELAGDVKRAPRPTVNVVDPALAEAGGSVRLTVDGSDFQPGAAVRLELNGNQVFGQKVTFVGETELKATMNLFGVVTGVWDVVVVNPDGGAGTLPEAFSIGAAAPAPTVQNIDPSEGLQGEPLATVHVTGANFDEDAILNVGRHINVQKQTFKSDKQIDAALVIAPDAKVGPRDVTVTNPDGQVGTLKEKFQVKPVQAPPKVDNADPPEGEAGNVVPLTIFGSGFVARSQVALDPKDEIDVGAQVVAPDGKSIKVTLTIAAAAEPGSRDLIVTNPDDQSSTLDGGFVVTKPLAIDRVHPSEGEIKQTLLITIHGGGFATNSTLDLGEGIKVQAQSVNPEGTKIKATLTIDGSAERGPRDVTVINPDTSFATKQKAFTVKAPVEITHVTPDHGKAGDNLNLTITGRGFQEHAQLKVAGSTFRPTTFVSATRLEAQITIPKRAHLGPNKATVKNPDDGTAEHAFSVDRP